jgi:hypothetical protein
MKSIHDFLIALQRSWITVKCRYSCLSKVVLGEQLIGDNTGEEPQCFFNEFAWDMGLDPGFEQVLGFCGKHKVDLCREMEVEDERKGGSKVGAD